MRLGCEHLYNCGLGSQDINRVESVQEIKQWMVKQTAGKKIIALSEIRNKNSLDLARELTSLGNQVFCTTVYSSISDIVKKFIKHLVPIREIGAFINALDWVITQRLVLSDENLVACREYLKFDSGVKGKILAIENLGSTEIGKEIENILAIPSQNCCSMLDSARMLLDKGQITKEIYGWIEIVSSSRDQRGLK